MSRTLRLIRDEIRPTTHARFDEWYTKQRPCYAPRTAAGLIRLAVTIMENGYPTLVEEGGVLLHLWRALKYTFRHFDPDKGTSDQPLPDRFKLAFRVWFRQHLRREKKRLRRPITLATRFRPPAVMEQVPDQVEDDRLGHEGWDRLLLRLALPRLDERTRRCLELRMEGETPRGIARRLRIAPKTAANRYSERRLIRAVRKAVRDMVLSMRPVDRLELVAHLVGPGGLTDAEVSALLCLPADVLGPLLQRARAGEVRGLQHEEAVALLAPPGRRAAA